MRNLLNNLFNPKKLNKKNASTKLELLNLEARLTPSTAQPIIPGQGSLNDFTAIGADSGGGPLVTVTFNNTDTLGNGPQYLSFFAYDPSFTGGVRVALGDVNGDGNRDIITAAGPSGSPHIKVFTINKDLVTGDFNVKPDSAPYQAFNQTLYDSALVAKEQLSKDIGTFNGFGRDPASSSQTIDFIFVSKNLQVTSYQVDNRRYNGLYPSDHEAVVAVISLK